MMCMTKRSILSNTVLFSVCLLVLTGCSKKSGQTSEKPDPNSAEYETPSPQDKPVTNDEKTKEAMAKKVVELIKAKQAEKSRADKPLAKDSLPPPPTAEFREPGDIIKQTALAMDNNDPEIRLDAMESLANEELSDTSILPVIARGLKDPDERVREAAVRVLFFVHTPEADKMLIQALNDTNEDVRRTALEAASEQDDKVRWDVLQSAITSPYPDVKDDTVSNLIGLSTHNTIDILISGLKDPDADFRQEVNSALNLLISKEFTNYDEAVKWWNKNKKNYDDELIEKETAQ